MLKKGEWVEVSRFGPPGFIRRLCAVDNRDEKAPNGWKRCMEGGWNFTRLCIGGYLLTKPADKLCSVRYVVTVTDEVSRPTLRCSVDGFCFPDLPRALDGGPGYERSTIAGELLRKRPRPGLRLYTIRIQVISKRRNRRSA